LRNSIEKLDVIELGVGSGMRVGLMNWGARIVSIKVPTMEGFQEVTVGYDNAKKYLEDPNYLGCTLGRYAGRIAGSAINIAGREYALVANEEHACLHGGMSGFDQQFWNVGSDRAKDRVAFTYQSQHLEEGFPGVLDVTVIYSLLDDFKLQIEYLATASHTTVVNLSNHTYFNLAADRSSVDGHLVSINADYLTRQNSHLIPDGQIVPVRDTRFDLRNPIEIGNKIFDQNYVLNKTNGEFELAVVASAAGSNIGLSMFTTQPGVQFYTGDFLAAPITPRAGLCFETQNYPDAPNQPAFPSALLHPGEVYKHQTLYQFTVQI